jgi:transcriptional regulator with XRE-family HTH domain
MLSRGSKSARSAAPHHGPGALLRYWRTHRRRSQMDLALEVGVSARHLSFIETGRSTPSPAMLMALADGLEVPLRERNQLLLAAGYAPRFAEHRLAEPGMASVLAALQRLLDAHQPYPGVVLDRHWNVVLANGAAQALASLLPETLRTPTLNIFRASLHPAGLAALTLNFAEWGRYLLAKLQRLAATDPAMQALADEMLQHAEVRALCDRLPPSLENSLLVPCVMALPFGRVSLFTTLTTFGTPRDITLDELCVELFYPSDAASEALLRQAAA